MPEAATAFITSASMLILGYVGQALLKRWTDRQADREKRTQEEREKQEREERERREKEPTVIAAQSAAWQVVVKELQDRVDAQHTRLTIVEKERDDFENRLRQQRQYYEGQLKALVDQYEVERKRDKQRIRELESRVEELEQCLAAQKRSPNERSRKDDTPAPPEGQQ